jgi:seryl-tRNA synthetase
MLDAKLIRNDPDAIRERLALRGFAFDVAQFNTLEAKRRALQIETERLQNERNARSKEIGRRKGAGEDVSALLAEVAGLGDRLASVKASFESVQRDMNDLLLGIPNLPDASVPPGVSEDDNVELRRWREPPEFNFEPRDHVDLGAGTALDFEVASRMSGSRFVVIHHQLARLQRALTQFMLDLQTIEHG